MALEIEKLKLILGIAADDTTQDGNLSFIVEDVEEIILTYCHLGKFPPGLLHTGYRMAIDLYRNENIGDTDVAGGAVIAIEEGDTKVQFNKKLDEDFSGTLLKNYTAQLNRYRKLAW
jgi:hypothetical protein